MKYLANDRRLNGHSLRSVTVCNGVRRISTIVVCIHNATDDSSRLLSSSCSTAACIRIAICTIAVNVIIWQRLSLHSVATVTTGLRRIFCSTLRYEFDFTKVCQLSSEILLARRLVRCCRFIVFVTRARTARAADLLRLLTTLTLLALRLLYDLRALHRRSSSYL